MADGGQPLRVLCLEDSPSDAELVSEAVGYEYSITARPNGVLAALARPFRARLGDGVSKDCGACARCLRASGSVGRSTADMLPPRRLTTANHA
jgi:hypothetical protein